MAQDPAAVFDPSVMKLMDKVRLEIHPEYAQTITQNALSRQARVEIRARGQTFAGERMFPKGTPSPDPESFMTTEELVRKFRTFVGGVVPAATVDQVIDSILNLEKVQDFAAVMRTLVWGETAAR